MLRISVDRPVTTAMIFVGVALLGIISWSKLPQEMFPPLDYPQISVVTKYKGASPEEAEKLISKLIEENVSTVKRIKRVSSISREGTSLVICEFSWGTNMDFAALDVREKIDLIKAQLPRDCQEPVVLKYNPLHMPAMILSVKYSQHEEDNWKLVGLRDFCRKVLKTEFERIDNVAKIEIRGGREKEVLVEVDKGALISNQMGLLDIIKLLKDSNITYPTGIIKETDYEFPVKVVGEFQILQDIRNLSILRDDKQQQQQEQQEGRRKTRASFRRAPVEKKLIYLKDIADIKDSIKEIKSYSRYNMENNTALSIYPQSGANLIKVSSALKKKIEELKPKFPADVDIRIIYDQSEFIKKSLNNIYISAVIGGILAFLILYWFLRNWAAPVIVCVSVPLSILATFSMMYFADLSINVMSLGGLGLGVGMLVDNSIVVLENIFANLKKYPDKIKRELIYESTSEVAHSIMSSTLTTIAVFLPLIFVTGMTGQLFKQLSLTVTFSLIASIFTGLFLVPRLALNMNLSKAATKVIEIPVLNHFPKLLSKFLTTPYKKNIGYLIIYISFCGVAFFIISKEFMPKFDERSFVINLSLPPETTLDINNNLTTRIEKILHSMPETKDMVVTIGSSAEEGEEGVIETLTSYQAKIVVSLTKSGRSSKKIVEFLNKEIESWHLDDTEVEFITQQGLFGSGLGATSGITVEVKGKDLTSLQKNSEKIINQMKDITEIHSIKLQPPGLVRELKVDVQQDKAALYGLSVQDVSSTLLASMKGYVATKYKQKEDEYDIRVRLRAEDRATISQVGDMVVFSPVGRNVMLKQMTEMQDSESLPEIRRIEGERTYLITFGVTGKFKKVMNGLKKILTNVSKPDSGITTEITGEALAIRESLQSSVFAFLLGLILIYMIIASTFESVSQPLIMMISVPLGLLGAAFTLFITFQSINAISSLGLIVLLGIVVNNGIILVDGINQERKTRENAGNFLLDIIIECTAGRLRPILMTNLTTILALIPFAFSGTNSSMAIAIIGGLSFGMMLTLFFVPLFYFMIEETGKSKIVKNNGDGDN